MRFRLKDVFYWLSFISFYGILCQSLSDDKSCDSRCQSGSKSKDQPECGVWSHSDNLKQVGGVYRLDGGYANLSCAITSLPRPATVKWYFQADGDDEFRLVTCDSMKTISECRFNTLGEHKVTSTCLIKITNLDQSGVYKCSGVIANKPSANSGRAHIQIHGISNFSQADNSTLSYGKHGEIRILICAYPKPDIVWIHDTQGISIGAGNSFGNYSAVPLHQLYELRGEYEPFMAHKYCYVARLIIAKVNVSDRFFTVVASNSVGTRHLKLKMNLANVPVQRKSAPKSVVFDKMIIACLFITTFFYNKSM